MPDFDFSHLKSYDVTSDSTTEMVLYQFAGEPTLIMKPALEANKPYFNAVLRRTGANISRMRAGRINADLVKRHREEDRSLFPVHIITGWKDVRSKDGETVEFSSGACKAFLSMVPDHIFDEIRSFAADITNFVDEQFDVEEQIKNL